jgi:hypothetical protein
MILWAFLRWLRAVALALRVFDGCALSLNVSRYRAHAPRALALRVFDGCGCHLMFRAIALTLRARLRFATD